jgi:hypothetical protein
MAKRIWTVTAPHTKHTSRDATYTTLQHTKLTTILLLRAPAISPGCPWEVWSSPPQNKLSCKAARAPTNAARPSVYTQQWCIHKERQCTSMGRGGGRRQECYSETVLSEAHYTRGYLYTKTKDFAFKWTVVLQCRYFNSIYIITDQPPQWLVY